jgi:BirA family biotin operon repressor/biotin-[acetyl-CoA-carboxylase] ligase
MNQSQLEQIAEQLSLGRVRFEETVTSTNDLAAEWAAEDAPHLSLIAADHQTAGRGRGKRKWFTPPNSALAFSLLLRPELPSEGLGRFSGLGALAVCETLRLDYRLQAEIKWPNDVLLDGKKVCGILPETIWTGSQLDAVILGIGINLAPHAYPKDIPLLYPATSVEESLGRRVDDAAFLMAVLAHLIEWHSRLDSPLFLAKWEQHLAFRGETIEIIEGGQTFASGRLAGLDEGGQLVLETEEGQRQSFAASEIHLRPLVDSPGKSATLNREPEE